MRNVAPGWRFRQSGVESDGTTFFGEPISPRFIRLTNLSNKIDNNIDFLKQPTNNVYFPITKYTENIIRDLIDTYQIINCAGIFINKSLEDSSIADFEKSFNINVMAPFIFCKQFSKQIIKNNWGRIINIASSSAYEVY